MSSHHQLLFYARHPVPPQGLPRRTTQYWPSYTRISYILMSSSILLMILVVFAHIRTRRVLATPQLRYRANYRFSDALSGCEAVPAHTQCRMSLQIEVIQISEERLKSFRSVMQTQWCIETFKDWFLFQFETKPYSQWCLSVGILLCRQFMQVLTRMFWLHHWFTL